MWVRSTSVLGTGTPGQRITLFDYNPSRGGAVPTRLLAGYEGALMVDGYQGYEPVCTEQKLVRLGYWVLARRKFVDVGKASRSRSGKSSQAAYAIKLIANLYRIEKAHRESSSDVRCQARLEKAMPILDKLRHWLSETKPMVPPKTTLGKALHYLDHQLPTLMMVVIQSISIRLRTPLGALP